MYSMPPPKPVDLEASVNIIFAAIEHIEIEQTHRDKTSSEMIACNITWIETELANIRRQVSQNNDEHGDLILDKITTLDKKTSEFGKTRDPVIEKEIRDEMRNLLLQFIENTRACMGSHTPGPPRLTAA